MRDGDGEHEGHRHQSPVAALGESSHLKLRPPRNPVELMFRNRPILQYQDPVAIWGKAPKVITTAIVTIGKPNFSGITTLIQKKKWDFGERLWKFGDAA
jgi:hypothetical protein